jgi:hypothetical protein
MIQSVLPLHECTDPAAAMFVAAKYAAETLHCVANSAAPESAVEPLQSIADSVAASATPTETSCS